jgi:predicted GNAT superfamily acetyltransferase
MAEIEIRECVSSDEFQQCLELQRRVWGFSDLDVVPLHIYIVTRGSGGFTLGAFTPTNEMVGFAHMLFARQRDRVCYYSHMLAVLPEYQNQGIGRDLKLGQRERALRRGIDFIFWTFDPLQALNAHLNINKLGVLVHTYEVNWYGSTGTSPLHQGLDTDRLVAEWWLNSDRVRNRLAGGEVNWPPPVATVVIPADINSLKTQDMGAARAWQFQVRQQFQEYFAAGLYVGGLEPSGDGSTYRYLLYQRQA